MISDARGGHVSPGVYTEEKEVTYSVKSLGITNLGLVGETLKGPAFQAIPIEKWSDFTDYFGGTSTEKYKGNGRPKYELPYIAKEYLTESKNLQVVRVLGLSGYKTSGAYVVKATFGEDEEYPLVILRSRVTYDTDKTGCKTSEFEMVNPVVKSLEILEYTGNSFNSECVAVSGESIEYKLEGTIDNDELGNYGIYDESGLTACYRFAIKVVAEDKDKKEVKYVYNVSLDSSDNDYIYNVLPSTPTKNENCPIFIEAFYDYAYDELIKGHMSGTTVKLTNGEVTPDGNGDFKSPFRCAQTPWIVSEVKSAGDKEIQLHKLFKFYTISDGDASNYQVKISITNVNPDPVAPTFDVLVRDFYDSDDAPVILEKYSRCNLTEGDINYIGYKIGTYDGSYATRSKYVVVDVNTELDGIASCVPAGFLGYPMPKYGCKDQLKMAYNTVFDSAIKTKRQYFGLNKNILDIDVLNYKGTAAYTEGDFKPENLANGFHLDSILDEELRNSEGSVLGNAIVTVDGISGYTFTTVSPSQIDSKYTKVPRIIAGAYMEGTIYEDKNLRKFTVYPYGGFDGWDINRTERTNSDRFKATKYQLPQDYDNCPFEPAKYGENVGINTQLDLKLPANAITSDYYAYLGAYNQFSNPQELDINLFTTPGIDWINNKFLFEDVCDMIEDSEDGRGGDALYIVTTPQFDNDGEMYTEDELADLIDSNGIKTSYACTYYPWVQCLDSSENKYVNLPVTKDVVRDMANTDNNLFPWFSSAGIERGNVNCVRALKKTTLAGESTLYGASINPVKTFAEDGVKIWGNKTMYDVDSPLNRINVRRLMIRVKKLVTSASKVLIFEQYDATLEKQFRSLVEPILENVRDNRGISDFRVVTESTPETRDQHILPARILIKPINALEYISISFVVYPESVEFDS